MLEFTSFSGHLDSKCSASRADGAENAGIYSNFMGTGDQNAGSYSIAGNCSIFLGIRVQNAALVYSSFVVTGAQTAERGLKTGLFSFFMGTSVREETEGVTLQGPGAFLHESCPSHWAHNLSGAKGLAPGKNCPTGVPWD